jgi:cell division protein FtsL
MGTLAAIWKKSDSMAAVSSEFLESDPYALRELPNDKVFFYSKKIDNQRLVRQADPHAADECWSAVGAGALLLMLGVSVVIPHVALVRTGYRLEAAKSERQTLLDQRRALEVREAALLSPSRLNDIAKEQNLTAPASGQVFHLDSDMGPRQGNLASNRMPAVPGR